MKREDAEDQKNYLGNFEEQIRECLKTGQGINIGSHIFEGYEMRIDHTGTNSSVVNFVKKPKVKAVEYIQMEWRVEPMVIMTTKS